MSLSKSGTDQLAARSIELQGAIGMPLAWERLDDRKASRLSVYYPGLIGEAVDEDHALIGWAVEVMVKTTDAVRPIVRSL